MRRFRNVPRHNGFRAWQVMTAPMNEHKAEVRKDLLKSVTHSVAAHSVEGLEKALEDWETTQRLFTEADGRLPDPEIMRLAYVGLRTSTDSEIGDIYRLPPLPPTSSIR